MIYARCVGLVKDVAYPTKPSSSQATKSHLGKSKSYEPKAMNETMLPMTISHTQHRNTLIPTPFQPKRMNGDVRKRENLHQNQEKVNKGKKQEES